MRDIQRNISLARLSLLMAVILITSGFAYGEEDAYTQVVRQRADRILEPLGVGDTARYERVRSVIMQFYRDLSEIQDAQEEAVKAIKTVEGLPQEAMDAAIQAMRAEVEKQLFELSFAFTGSLAAELEPAEVVAVKDGITYGVVPLTYGVYLEMLPDLTAEQKHFILAQLNTAREYALLAGSSQGRHHEFGRAKGRINNMLSAAGIDMKQAEADMRTRKAGSK